MLNFKNTCWLSAYKEHRPYLEEMTHMKKDGIDYYVEGNNKYNGKFIIVYKYVYKRKDFKELYCVKEIGSLFNQIDHYSHISLLSPKYLPVYFPDIFMERIKTVLLCLKKINIKLPKFIIYDYFGNICNPKCKYVCTYNLDSIRITYNDNIIDYSHDTLFKL